MSKKETSMVINHWKLWVWYSSSHFSNTMKYKYIYGKRRDEGCQKAWEGGSRNLGTQSHSISIRKNLAQNRLALILRDRILTDIATLSCALPHHTLIQSWSQHLTKRSCSIIYFSPPPLPELQPESSSSWLDYSEYSLKGSSVCCLPLSPCLCPLLSHSPCCVQNHLRNTQLTLHLHSIPPSQLKSFN